MSDERKQYCTFYVAGHLFGVPVDDVQEVIRHQEVTSVPLAPGAVRGLINLRGQIVTAIDLRKQLRLAGDGLTGAPINIVVRTDDGPVSLLVDEIGDVVDIDESTWEPTPSTVNGRVGDLLEGIYKLPGKLLLILATDKAVEVEGVAAAR